MGKREKESWLPLSQRQQQLFFPSFPFSPFAHLTPVLHDLICCFSD